MAEPLPGAPAGVGAQTPGYRRLPLVDSTSPRPRRRRHAVAAALVTAYLLAAVVVIVARQAVPVPQWLALHLLLLGAATNAVFVWSRHFTQALLHTRPGSENPAHARLGVLNAGVVSVLAGVAAAWTPLAIAGATLVAAAVIAHVMSLIAMARGATMAGRLRITVRFYVAGGFALALGASLGAVLASHAARSDAWERAVVLTHAHLNVLGWLGLSVIGTQFMLWPAVLRTRMAEDAPAVARRVLTGAVAGLAVTVASLLLSPELDAAHWMAAAGMALYAGSVAYSLKPALSEVRTVRPRSAPAFALLAGNLWLIAALGIDVVGLAFGTDTADALLDHVLVPVLGIGVVAQILTGALSFLLPVTVGGGPAGNRRMSAVLAYGWPVRAALGNAGVTILAATSGQAWRVAGWIGVLAGFGSFPLLIAAALVAVRTPASQAAGDEAMARRTPGLNARSGR